MGLLVRSKMLVRVWWKEDADVGAEVLCGSEAVKHAGPGEPGDYP